jgi:hypothetical protein
MSNARFITNQPRIVVSCPVCFAVTRDVHLAPHLAALHPDVTIPPEPVEPEPGVTVTAGTPGAFHGIDSTELTSIGDLNDLGLALGAAWVTGQYVEYSYPPKRAHWNGTKFKAAPAT